MVSLRSLQRKTRGEQVLPTPAKPVVEQDPPKPKPSVVGTVKRIAKKVTKKASLGKKK